MSQATDRHRLTEVPEKQKWRLSASLLSLGHCRLSAETAKRWSLGTWFCLQRTPSRLGTGSSNFGVWGRCSDKPGPGYLSSILRSEACLGLGIGVCEPAGHQPGPQQVKEP